MLIDKLRAWEYYYKKLPLYMRNSYGIKEHFEMVWNVMMQLEWTQENVLDVMNLLQNDYIRNVIAKYDNVDGYDFAFLDMIGSLYGVNRSLNVQYIGSNGDVVHKKLYLTNKEFYMLIKARIVQNNYDGTFEQARAYYENIGLPMYMLTGANPAECYLYLVMNDNTTTDNIRDLFMANLLTLKSVGITYIRRQIDIGKMAVWAGQNDAPNNNNTWNVSVWL